MARDKTCVHDRVYTFKTWAMTPIPLPIDFNEADVQAVSTLMQKQMIEAFDDNMFLGESFAETQRINRLERKPMSFQKATYEVPRDTREVELKFTRPITHGPALNYSVFPPRFTGGIPTRHLHLEVPGSLDRLLIIVDETEMAQFERFKKAQSLKERIVKVNDEIENHERQERVASMAHGRACEEKARLRRELSEVYSKD